MYIKCERICIVHKSIAIACIIHVIIKNIGRPVLVIVCRPSQASAQHFFYKYRVKVLQISHGGFTCDPVNVGSII